VCICRDSRLEFAGHCGGRFLWDGTSDESNTNVDRAHQGAVHIRDEHTALSEAIQMVDVTHNDSRALEV